MSSPAPTTKPKEEAPVARTLAYEQAIAQPREEESETGGEDAGSSATDDIPAFDTVTSATPDGSVDPAQDLASLPDESGDLEDGADGTAEDMAALPGGQPSPYDAAQPPPDEPGPGQDAWGTDGAEQWGDDQDPPWADGPPPGDPYGPPGGDPYAQDDHYASQGDPYGPPGGDPYGRGDPNGPPGGDPYAQGDPYGPPQDPWGGQDSEQWVEVIISGAAMRATASEEAPMLFAFPYGRNLKVVSRSEGWVEVTDPRSSATGWMQAHTLAPSTANQRPYGQTEAYYDEPRQRRGWLRRNADGFSDMINRALGGGF